MAASRWEAAGISVRGARHAVDGTPCQDAVRVYQDDDFVIVAVADGHGDPKHARSDEGARLAVEVTALILRELGAILLRDAPAARHPLEIQADLKRHLPGRISWEWNRRVRAHAGHGDQDGAWHEDVNLYGCTLLGALFTDTLGVFVQLGDGDILLVEEPGGPRCVFPLHDDIYGSVTHSLCQPGAVDYARVRCERLAGPRLAMLASDGVRDCLLDRPEAFLEVGTWLLGRITRQGFAPAMADLPGWLGELTRRGNGDDVTTGIVHWMREEEEEAPR